MRKLTLLILSQMFGIILTYTDRKPPQIKDEESGTYRYFAPGEPVRLRCQADGKPEPRYYWTRNGKSFDISDYPGNVVQIPEKGDLLFKHAGNLNEGRYQCFAKNDYGTSVSDTIYLVMGLYHAFDGIPDTIVTYNVDAGKPLTLRCMPPYSRPPADIYWSLERSDGRDEPLQLDNRVSMDLEGNLHIKNVRKSDERDGASYACMAMNTIVRIVQKGPTYRVKVSEQKALPTPVHKLWMSPGDWLILQNETLRLICIFAGNPTPEVEWEGPFGILSGDTKFENLGQELRIRNVQKSDEGKYVCTGRNSLGSHVSNEFYVKVESAPFWVEKPKDVEASISGKATFICKAEGDPKPDYTWYINGVPLEDSEDKTGVRDPRIYNNERFSMKDPSTLTLTNLTLEDQMNIQCNASNKHGYVFSDVYLHVTTNILNTVSIDVQPKDVEVIKGNNVTFICSMNKDEEIDIGISWEKDGDNTLTDNHRVIADQNSLSIYGAVVEDTGVYTCVIRTDEGGARAYGSLKVIDRPYPPQQVEIISCMAHSAMIKWVNGNDNNAPIQYLDIQYSTFHHPELWTTATKVNYTDRASVSLSPYANYTFRVIASNKVGNSLPSFQTSSVCRTPPERPFTNPRNVTSVRDTKGVLEIKWNPMKQEKHNGPYFGYQVYYKKRDMSQYDDTYMYTTHDWRTNSVQVTVKQAYTPYLVKVQARNALGSSVEDPIEYTLYSYEDTPKVRPFDVMVTDKGKLAAEVTWKWYLSWLEEQGEINEIQGPLKGFKISYWCSEKKSDTLEEVFVQIENLTLTQNHEGTQMQSSKVLTNLTRCKYIHVQVAVINNFYAGIPSEAIRFFVGHGIDLRPPKIIEQPRSKVFFYKTGQQVKLLCIANGNPKPRYRWTKNGEPYSPSVSRGRVAQVDGEGTLVIKDSQYIDEGIYQCQAENSYGVSVADKVYLRKAKMGTFQSGPKRNITVEAGSHLTLPCYPPISVPHANIVWALMDTDQRWTPVNTDDRVSIDIEGNLRFSNVKKSDEKDGRLYSCAARNNVLRMIVHGPAIDIRVSGNNGRNHPVTTLYASPSDMIFLKGDKMRLQCIFAGNPTPEVEWERPHGTSGDFVTSGQDFRKEDVQISDRGQYMCTGRNSLGQHVSKLFNVRVESAPFWVEKPKDVEANINDIATFICKAEGDPKPEYAWYINNIPMTDGEDETGVRDPRIYNNERFSMKDPSTITLTNLTLEYQMNIQCNASNKYGYVFSDVYLHVTTNILNPRPPNIVEQPRSRALVFRPGVQVKILCKADGHPKPKYRWTRNGKPYSFNVTGGHVQQVDGEGTLVFNNTQYNDEGIYQCLAENSFGVSVADKILLQKAKLGTFYREPIRTHIVEIGTHLTLPCYPPISIPPANTGWILMDTDQTWTAVNSDDRVSVDIEGRLLFVNVKKSDQTFWKTYRCAVINYELRIIEHGPGHRVEIIGNKRKHHPVTELYISPKTQIFLKGEKLRLQCIFAGYPTPRVNWKKLTGTLPDRARLIKYGQELQISDLQESDAGRYECTANSGEKNIDFDVRIESAPFWVEDLKNVVATVNDEAKFVCKADGNPKPQYTWYINGKPLDRQDEGDLRDPRIDNRFTMKDPYTIILSNLTLEDQMNIQCNASNKHGYVFSDVYLNIVENSIESLSPPQSSPLPPPTTEDISKSSRSYEKGHSDTSTRQTTSQTTSETLTKEQGKRESREQENSRSKENATDLGGSITANQSHDIIDQES